MRQLDTCDFCGDPADGVYEVLPDGVDADERRLVLCTHCHEVLAGVVGPLVAALDGDTSGGVTPSNDPSPGASADASPSPPADGRPDADAPADVEARDAAADADVSEAAAATAAASSATATSDDRPEGYAKVVRLLRNRPEAMSRADLTELATGAYDLSERDVEAAVDAAVENGHVEETSAGLRAA
ncbi:MAG: hypothetical protein ABEJ80_07265 [Halarchaeum sp.]